MTTPTKLFMSTGLLAVLVAVALPTTSGFNIGARFITRSLVTPQRNTWPSTPCGRGAAPLSAEEWSGEVASNTEDGKIRGCMINPEGETSFTIRLDGEEADLGKFSSAIYKKITADGKKQSFQGFRPGTIPPHLLPTYKAFAMDEVAKEAILEAMQQNNIRPFDTAREDLDIVEISIPPRKSKKKSSKKKKKKATVESAEVVLEEAPPAWLTFDNMKEALKAGWEPGESFSFVAKNCRGQQLKDINSDASASLASLKNE